MDNIQEIIVCSDDEAVVNRLSESVSENSDVLGSSAECSLLIHIVTSLRMSAWIFLGHEKQLSFASGTTVSMRK